MKRRFSKMIEKIFGKGKGNESLPVMISGGGGLTEI
jgi:hypothetical protein